MLEGVGWMRKRAEDETEAMVVVYHCLKEERVGNGPQGR